MGLDIGLWKICGHITGGHKFLSPQGGDFFIVEEGRVFFNIGGERIFCSKITIPPHWLKLARLLQLKVEIMHKKMLINANAQESPCNVACVWTASPPNLILTVALVSSNNRARLRQPSLILVLLLYFSLHISIFFIICTCIKIERLSVTIKRSSRFGVNMWDLKVCNPDY